MERDFQMLFAHSGMEAIALLEARSDVDVILMDLQMPIMDGFEAAARIKKIRGCESIPIIFITAVYTEDPFIKRGYEVAPPAASLLVAFASYLIFGRRIGG